VIDRTSSANVWSIKAAKIQPGAAESRQDGRTAVPEATVLASVTLREDEGFGISLTSIGRSPRGWLIPEPEESITHVS
jgi:hypothetical protein